MLEPHGPRLPQETGESRSHRIQRDFFGGPIGPQLNYPQPVLLEGDKVVVHSHTPAPQP
jgi:hypothetical protein